MSDEGKMFSLGALVGFIVGGIFFPVVGFHSGVADMKLEAVRRGVAEWVADSQGNAEFRWKAPVEKGDVK